METLNSTDMNYTSHPFFSNNFGLSMNISAPQCAAEHEDFICSYADFSFAEAQNANNVDLTDFTQAGWIWACIGLYAPLCLLGTIGNVLTIIVFAKYIKWTPTSVFIIALAIVDLLVCAVRMPIWLYELIDSYHGSDILCKVNNIIYLMSILMSGVLLLLIAVDRFILIFLVRLNVVTSFVAKLSVVILSIVCISIAVPQALCFTTYVPLHESLTGFVCDGQINCNAGNCGMQFELMTQETWYKLWQSMIVILLLTVAAFTTMYGLIFAKVYSLHKRMQKWRQTTNFASKRVIEVELSTFSEKQQTSESDTSNSASSGSSGSAVKVDKKARKSFPHVKTALTLFLVTICFVVSYAPLVIMMLLGTCTEEFSTRPVCDKNDYRTFIWHFYFINHASNPVIYALMNPRFRAAVRGCASSLRKSWAVPNKGS